MKKIIVGVMMLLFGFSVIPVSAIGYGIPKAQNHEPPSPGKEIAKMIQDTGGYYIGDTTKKEVYLTFDNGYENGYTSKVLDTLKAQKVPGIFFITGHYLKTAPDLVVRMVEEGHLVGNHSYHHPDFTKLSKDKMKQEIDQLNVEYEKLVGKPMSTYFRPPEGTFNQESLAYVSSLGYTNLFWSLAYQDWDVKKQKGEDFAYHSVVDYIHPGAIILLHTVSKDNADALEKIIIELKKQGYTFKSVDQLT